jgi:hypothetical protein
MPTTRCEVVMISGGLAATAAPQNDPKPRLGDLWGESSNSSNNCSPAFSNRDTTSSRHRSIRVRWHMRLLIPNNRRAGSFLGQSSATVGYGF